MPDTIYYNGEINTFDENDHVYEAVAIKEGKILAVGDNNSVKALKSERTKLIDLHNKTVLPGFIDAHLHLFSLGFNLSYVDCKLGSIEEVKVAIKEHAKTLKTEEEWIIGWGFDESNYIEGRKLNKHDFSDIKNPVYITRYCLHEAVINEAAIQQIRITNSTSVKGGIIERSTDGEPTGLLKEKAMDLVVEKLPPYSTENMKKAIQLANNYLLQKGITSVHDAGLGFLVDPFKEFEVLREMSEDQSVQIKMYVMVLAEYYQEFYEKYQYMQTEKLKIGSLKLFADGTLGGQTAALFDPYLKKEENGLLLYTDQELKERIKIAYDLNRQVAVHAIGDRAIDQVLRMYESLNEEYPEQETRPRIEHTTVSNDAIRERMRKVNAIPVPQPTLIYHAGDSYHLEKERLNNIFAVKSFMEQGLRPAGSSDSPVTDCDPLIGIYAAMSRETINGKFIGEKENIRLKDAIKMYTIHAAYAAFEEDIKGSIEVNKDADFVILPEGFMNYSSEQVREAKVEKIIINGEIVFFK